jgi:iron complex outermembrane recepter protein
VNVSEVKVSGNRMRRIRLIAVTSLLLALPGLMVAQSNMQTVTSASEEQTGSQPAGAALEGTVSDTKGGLIAKATVIVRNDATGRTKTAIADDAGHFSIAGLPVGTYTVDASAPGFAAATLKSIHVAADHADSATLTLQIGAATADVTVEADATGSVAAALAPMDTLLSATSARTEITSGMIQNFMSPIADFGEAVEMAPGTFTTNSNGVGLGQATTVFRGFPDGDYDIDFDGIPFYDTNTPSHHTWAFFPSQWIGGIDFDRSPGTASTIGPTPFGGSIHLLSRPFNPLQNIRGEFVGGSYHTYLYDGEYDSGQFGPGHKFNVMVDVHHTQSDGYQTFNFQTRNAGDIQVQYKLSDKTTITGYSGVVWVDANTPNFSATRCQMFGVSASNAYSCALAGTPTGLEPFTGAGLNFLNTNNSDPELYLDYQYNYYHVPTDFEYVEVHKVFGHGFVFDSKPYTYNYDNSEKFTNAVPISDNPALANTVYAPLGAKVVLCTTAVVKKGVTAIPCGVDKYNSYRKYGETSELDQFSKYGVFRGGIWYDWALTHRHQFPSDPLNHWADQALSNFNETFITSSYQPFAEYQYHATKKLDIDAGVKFAYYTVSTKQFADDGKTIGGLGTNNPDTFVTDGGSYFATLPSANANYRIRKNWSAYAQFAQGSIVPPSSVFDFNHGTSDTNLAPLTPPKQQRNTTYQGGSAVKLKRATLDVDYYYIRFQSGYSSITGPDGEPEFFLQPSSTTEGVEGQSNLSFGHGFGAYLNATHGKAYYRGEMAAVAVTTGAPTLEVAVPNGQNVQETPSDTETEAITYQHKAFDFGLFNKRVGTFFLDNGSYHNQETINPFSVTNLFFNYTVRSGGMFDQTKFRLSFNNLFNEHNDTGLGDTFAGTAPTTTLTQGVNGTTYTYTNPFISGAQTPVNGEDSVSILPGRSIMVSVIFGFSPHRH